MSASLTNEAADKLAVVDALYRFAAGIDLRDKSLRSSALAENTVLDFRPTAATVDGDLARLNALVEARHVSRGE